jgi:hypothetical protein
MKSIASQSATIHTNGCYRMHSGADIRSGGFAFQVIPGSEPALNRGGHSTQQIPSISMII